MDNTLLLLILLMAKHTVADYFFQTSWMIQDKSIYAKRGGIAHAKLHGLLTFFVLWPLGVPAIFAIMLSALDAFIHYHVDYVKSNWMKKHNPSPNSQPYWAAHGIDQFLHFMTYILLIVLLS